VYMQKETTSKVTIFNCNKSGIEIFKNFCLDIYWSDLVQC
jgi:hypothetical protein